MPLFKILSSFVVYCVEGYLITFKSNNRSIFQDDTYTITVEAKSNTNELLTNSCIVTAINEDKIVFNPNLVYDSISDIDYNTYKTIVIGDQTWMAENLKTTRYSNGELIGTTSSPYLDIQEENNPKYQWASSGKEGNVEYYGRLYTWYTVNDNRNLCPTKWHVPSKVEWDSLLTYIGGEGVAAGNKLKEVGEHHWWTWSNRGATDESGFTAIPAGSRLSNGFFSLGGVSWWSSSEPNDVTSFHLNLSYDMFFQPEYDNHGSSVRCVKD